MKTTMWLVRIAAPIVLGGSVLLLFASLVTKDTKSIISNIATVLAMGLCTYTSWFLWH